MFYALFDSPWFVAGLIALVVLGIEIGIQLGRFERRRAGGDGEFKLGVVQNAVLGVIALLTGFTFSAASSMHQMRAAQVREQADSIAETWRRTDLVDPETRIVVRAALLEYLDAELLLHTQRRGDLGHDQASARSDAAQAAIWSAAVASARSDSHPTLVLADPVNRLIQRHFARIYTLRGRTPAPMIIIVLVGAAISAMLLGVSWGGAAAPNPDGRPRPVRSLAGYLLFTLMMALTVMVIRDLDQPYQGLLRIDEANLTELREFLRKQQDKSAAVPAPAVAR